MPKAKWITSNRQNALIRLFLDSGGFCVFHHKGCLNPEHHYIEFIEALIRDWQLDDRQQASLEWQAESKALHSLAQRTFPVSGQFNAVSRDIYAENQPLYYIEGYGLSALTAKPFVKVRLSSTYMRLHINLGDTLKHLSKNKRRKVVRYDKGGLPLETEKRVKQLIREAVRDYRK